MNKLIIALIVIAPVTFGANAQTKTVSSTQKVQTASQAEKHATLKVQGSCGMCKTNIEKAAIAVKGVSSAEWNIKTKDLKLTYNPLLTDLQAVSKAIAKAGYDAGDRKAPQSVYDALPPCCKYR